MKIEKVLVTPEMAAKLLAKNSQNRRLDTNRLQQYCNDIRLGKWREDTGELIKVSDSDELIDGQHRLMAVVKTGIPIYFHLAYGVKSEVFDVLDSGKGRTKSDVFNIAGVSNANIITSVIQTYYQFTSTNLRAGKHVIGTNLTSRRLLEEYNKRRYFWDNIAKQARHLYTKFSRVWTPKEIGFFYAILTEIDNEKAIEFLRQICEGTDVEFDCIKSLRNRMILDKVDKKKAMQNSYRRALVIKCWNAFYTNKDVKVLKFDAEKESYPEILGMNRIN